MKIIILIMAGALGGIIGGMGMGGGTILIPLLTIFAGVNQHIAQSVNLIAFIPMSIVALIVHFKNKLVDAKKAIWIAIPAILVSIGSSALASVVDSHKLSKYFGIFLLILGVYQLIAAMRNKIKSKRIKER